MAFKRNGSLLSLSLQNWAIVDTLSASSSSFSILSAHRHVFLSCSPHSICPDCQPPLCMSEAQLTRCLFQTPFPDTFTKGHRNPSGLTQSVFSHGAEHLLFSFAFGSGPCICTMVSRIGSSSYSPWCPCHCLHPQYLFRYSHLPHPTNSASLSVCTKEYEHLIRNAPIEPS